MDARIIDTRDGSTVMTYPDWDWSPDTVSLPERFGHVRAEESAADLNRREADERFKVERVGPKVGGRVTVRAYGRERRGEVTEVKVCRSRLAIRVRWYNKKGDAHEHWYDIRDLRRAGTKLCSLWREVY